MGKIITEIPKNIIMCNLECILMPNGELISRGKHIGWFREFEGLVRNIKHTP